MSRVPKQWDELDADWLTAAIAEQHPGARVGKVAVVMRDDGSNRRARLGLGYQTGSGPESVFAKAHNKAHRIVHLRNGNLFGEARLFASGVPLPLEHPTVYRAIVDRPHLDFLIVMEDVNTRGADLRDATRPMTADQVANGVRGLARLHARYWNLSPASQPRLRWVKTWKPTRGWQTGLRRRIPAGLERAADLLPAELRSYGADRLMDLWVAYVRSLASGPATLLHGDAHIGNTYLLPDGEVGFLDWQVVRRGHWSQDVGYFLVGALTEEDRRTADTDILADYRRTLDLPREQLPSVDEAWLRYRASPAYGLPIWLSTLGSVGYQSEEISRALVSRYATAFMELRTGEAMRQLTYRRS